MSNEHHVTSSSNNALKVKPEENTVNAPIEIKQKNVENDMIVESNILEDAEKKVLQQKEAQAMVDRRRKQVQ